MRHSERQLCIKYCTLSRVGVDARPMNVEICVGICICFICIPKIRYWSNIFISHFYYHNKVTMVTVNYLRLRRHFHKEPFGYPWWNGLFDEENTYFSQIKHYIAAFYISFWYIWTHSTILGQNLANWINSPGCRATWKGTAAWLYVSLENDGCFSQNIYRWLIGKLWYLQHSVLKIP